MAAGPFSFAIKYSIVVSALSITLLAILGIAWGLNTSVRVAKERDVLNSLSQQCLSSIWPGWSREPPGDLN
jgi:hypothetical protein